jgi:hypothetical protein
MTIWLWRHPGFVGDLLLVLALAGGCWYGYSVHTHHVREAAFDAWKTEQLVTDTDAFIAGLEREQAKEQVVAYAERNAVKLQRAVDMAYDALEQSRQDEHARRYDWYDIRYPYTKELTMAEINRREAEYLAAGGLPLNAADPEAEKKFDEAVANRDNAKERELARLAGETTYIRTDGSVASVAVDNL